MFCLRLILLSVLSIFLGITLIFIGEKKQQTERVPSSELFQVVATFYPIAEFVRQVGGLDIEVTTITPSGYEPHDYEPTAEQIASIYKKAKVFFYNGSGMDPWASRLALDLEKKGITTVSMSQVIDLLQTEDTSVSDPHFWLDPLFAKREVELIRDILSQKDPVHHSDYAKRASRYLAKLDALNSSYVDGLISCQKHFVITSHEAFGYLAKRYGFEALALTGISSQEEPSANRLAQLAKLINEYDIQYIYFETLTSPKLSETLANEVGAKTLVFNPLEGLTLEEAILGKNYITIMQENLEHLKIGLVCP